MRRDDKLIKDEGIIKDILAKNNICRLAFHDEVYPYIVPVNYGYSENKIYFHSAREGKKIDLLNQNNNICFEITDSIEIAETEKACNFSTKFRSVIGYGKIIKIEDNKSKINALNIIMKSHTGTDKWEFSEIQVQKVSVFEIDIDSLTGKISE